MSVGAFSNAILRNFVMSAGALVATSLTKEKLITNPSDFVRAITVCAGSLVFGHLAFGLGGSLGNHYFNTATKWTLLKTAGQVSTQVAFGSLLCGIAFLAAIRFLKPGSNSK